MTSGNTIKLIAISLSLSLLMNCADAEPNIALSGGSSVQQVEPNIQAPSPIAKKPPATGGVVATTPPKSENAEGGSASLGNFRLLSSAFKNLQPMPPELNTKSPPLNWSGKPAGTGSFAIQIVDTDAEPPTVLWTITDIPLDTETLPGGVKAGNNLLEPPEAEGADQPNPYKGLTPVDEPHRIEVTLYAIIPNVGLKIGTDAAANKAELEGKSVGKTILTGVFE